MTKAQIKALQSRITALREELKDPTCQKFPTARRHVEAELQREIERLAAGSL